MKIKKQKIEEKFDDKNPLKTKAPLFDFRLLAIGLVAFLAITGPIGFLIVQSINKPPRELRIDIRNKSINKNDSKFKVDECEDCKKLVIRNANNDIVFEESLEGSNKNSFREYLLNLAKEGDSASTPLKVFNNAFQNRLVDISLDISNSVLYRNQKAIKSKADNTYSDLVFQKLKNLLESHDNLLPRDTIFTRFYGPEFKDNPCNNKLTVKYTEPEWDASITYSQRNKELLIEIGNQIPPKTEKSGAEIRTNDQEVIFKSIKDYWEKGIVQPNPECHSGTFLIPHLTKISDDIANKQYSDYEFALITDGEFYLRDDQVTDGKEVYATHENYDVLKKYIQNKTDKAFKSNGSAICKKPTDRFMLIGMEYDNNLSFRSTVQQFLNELLQPCGIVFENF